MLDELERDALAELMNLGAGRAAAKLRVMVGQEVLLSVPAVSVCSPEQARSSFAEQNMLAVRMWFAGEFSGRTLLIFTEGSGAELAEALTGHPANSPQSSELAPDALCETANILVHACLGAIGGLVGTEFTISTPSLVHGAPAEFFSVAEMGLVVLVYVNFSIRHRQVKGYFAWALDLPSVAALKQLIDAFIKRHEITL
jgi:chemotaxis protein CheC